MSDINREEVEARVEAGKARIAAVMESLRADRAEARAENATFRAEVKTALAELRSELHQSMASQTRWIVLIVFGAIATAVSLLRFFGGVAPT